MTSKRRHPAQTSRILATGLSAATLLGIVAVLGAQPPAPGPDGPGDPVPPRATVVIGDRHPNPSGRQPTTQQAGQRPHTSTHPS